jgi:hypothetical protein
MSNRKEEKEKCANVNACGSCSKLNHGVRNEEHVIRRCCLTLKTVFTFTVKAFLQDVLDGFFTRLQGVFSPGLAVVRPENYDFSFLASERAKMRHLNDHRPAIREEKLLQTSYTQFFKGLLGIKYFLALIPSFEIRNKGTL